MTIDDQTNFAGRIYDAGRSIIDSEILGKHPTVHALLASTIAAASALMAYAVCQCEKDAMDEKVLEDAKILNIFSQMFEEALSDGRTGTITAED